MMPKTAATPAAKPATAGMAAAKLAAAPGVVLADAVYTLAEFRRRMRLGDTIWRTVGPKLAKVKIGQVKYIRGAVWLQFIEQLAAQQVVEGGPA